MSKRQLQEINSSGELTEIRLLDTTDGSKVLTSDEIDAKIVGITTNAGDILSLQEEQITQNEAIALNTDKISYPGDQDLSALALKSNVLELDNTTAFTPDADYEPATKKYVDDISASLTGAVTSVNTETGDVVLTTGDIGVDADYNYVTDAQQTVIENTSGVNTGDQDLSNYLDLMGTKQMHSLSTTPAITGTVYLVEGSGVSSGLYNLVVFGVDITSEFPEGTYIAIRDSGANVLGYRVVTGSSWLGYANQTQVYYRGIITGTKYDFAEVDGFNYTPNLDYDVATKKYIDDAISSGLDVSGLIPYTGADQDPDLGTHFISHGGAKYHAYTYTEILAIAAPVEGMMVWNTTTKKFNQYNGSIWQEMTSGAGGGTVTSVAVTGSDGIEIDSGSPITSSGTIALGVNADTLRTHLNVADGSDVGTVTEVTSTTTNQLTVATGTSTPELTIVTGAVSSESTDLVTSGDIYSFIESVFWTPTFGELNVQNATGLSLGTAGTWFGITGLEAGPSNNITQSASGFTIIDSAYYEISVTGSLEYTVSLGEAIKTDDINIAVFVNAAEQVTLETVISSADGKNISFVINGLKVLAAADVVSLSVKATKTGTFGLGYGNFVIKRIGTLGD